MKSGEKKYVLFLFFLFPGIVFLTSCAPVRKFEKTKHPPAPDYSMEHSWISLPWTHDIGDSVPPGNPIPEDQKSAAADIFYIHPTVYLSGIRWNASLSRKKVNAYATRCVKLQGTAFNASGRLFAPRYRQAHLKAFLDKRNGPSALDLAYADVKAAFQHYLDNWNHQRPLIIAGHSQGTRHAIRLLKDFFDGKELQKLLVAAYLVGMPVDKNEFSHIPVGDSASQINCFVTWNTVPWGTGFFGYTRIYRGKACVNPLTWKANENYAPASLNLGGVPFSFKRIDKEVCDAMVHNGALWVHNPGRIGYLGFWNTYHLSDFNLFYMNIRENAKRRVEAFISR